MINLIFKCKYILLNDEDCNEINYSENNKKFIPIPFKCLIIFFLFIFNIIKVYDNKILVEIDNKLNESFYEEDLNFSNYSNTNIKPIALYFPQFSFLEEFYSFNNNYLNEWKAINKSKSLFIGHRQPRNLDNKYRNILNKNLSKIEIIKMQIKIAKNHGLYGFGFIYYWFSGKILYNEPINLFLNNNIEINFPFLIIWKNDKYEYLNEENEQTIIIEQNYSLFEQRKFIKDIKQYLISKTYIKINKIPILVIYDTSIIPNPKTFLSNLRNNFIILGIGKVYIYGTIEVLNNFTCIEYFDSCVEIPPKSINLTLLLRNDNYYYYQGLIYRNKNKIKNNKIYPGFFLEYDNTPEKKENLVFCDYSPEKLYLMIQLIYKSKFKNKSNKNFLFINGWNNWREGSYLEPDIKYGYASLNAISKALFNISFNKNNINLRDLKINCKIAVQAHIFYEDLIYDIINKTNNIPGKFDLFISTTSLEIKNTIEKYIKQYSKSNKLEIIIIKNKGRDVLPLLIQLNSKIKYYKYLCHIHSKKSKTCPEIGISWRNYLFNNILGNEIIVSEILSDFENNDKLGFIFPETFYDIIIQKLILTKGTLKYMNYILKKIFPNHSIGNQIDFPAGNMFWARIKSIFQIFEIKFYNKFGKEKDKTNDTIMHGIERIWLYLVKLNGYYYKTIFKSIF